MLIIHRLIAKFLALLVCALSVLGASVAFQAGSIDSFSVNPYGGDEAAIDTIRWYSAKESYYLFLPSDTNLADAKIYFSAVGTVLLDGAVIESGENALGLTEGSHTLSCGTKSCPLEVRQSAALPAVFINTASGSLDYIHADKENKEPGSIRVYENGTVTLDKGLKQIKGRGNSTWFYSKKPYNIKFDKKTSLLGMAKAKKWTLLANFVDVSLLHNAYAWEFASALGLDYTSEYRHVDLYANGNYLGNYVICESVEVGENRVEITDLEKANENVNEGIDLETLPTGGIGENGDRGSRKWIEIPQNPADISGGYLLEYEFLSRYLREPSGFVTKNGQPIVIKSPEYASQAEVTEIADFMDAATEALYSPTGFNEAGMHYSDYFDMDTLVKAYLMQELSMNIDACFTSFFAYKPANDAKLYFGPVWDMDCAFGSPITNFDVPVYAADLWYVNQLGREGIPVILAAAFRHADFRAAVREKWAELDAAGVLDAVQARVDELSSQIRASAEMNELRWRSAFISRFKKDCGSFQECVQISADFVANRRASLCKGLAADGAYICYDLNGVQKGAWATVSKIHSIGETTELASIVSSKLIPPDNKLFYCWNTQPDGSGQSYFPGDSLLLEHECTVLYAIWKTQEEIDYLNHVVPFEDVSPDKYYYDSIFWAYYHDPRITSGTSETLFSPGKTCTREQVITFLYAAAGRPAHHQSESPFSDVVPGTYYYNAVMWALENGITGGVGDGKFGVGRPCTREQVVCFLWNAAGRPEHTLSDAPFNDVKPGNYYYDAVLWAAENRVTGGMGNRIFGVGKPCTRAQVVTFLYTAFS